MMTVRLEQRKGGEREAIGVGKGVQQGGREGKEVRGFVFIIFG